MSDFTNGQKPCPRCAELESQLTKARAEAEKYRELLGIARDHAHAALVDTEGNVI